MSAAKILYMDDDKALRDLYSQYLMMTGYAATCVANGEQAITVWRAAQEAGAPFAVAILDWHIRGGMGAGETLGELRKIDPEIKAMVTSGDSTDPWMIEPKKHGFVAAIAKPFHFAELAAML